MMISETATSVKANRIAEKNGSSLLCALVVAKKKQITNSVMIPT